MTFLDPAAFGFLALLPLVVLLYMLKLRRVSVRVPSLLLWSRMVEDFRANTPFQRLRKNLLLLLQLLILALLVLAMAKPVWQTRGIAGNRVVLIIDTSLSMKARDGAKTTRFAEAIEKAQGTIDRLGVGDELAILEAGPQSQVLLGFGSDQRAMRQVLAQLSPKDGPGNLREALSLGVALLKGKPNGHVFVASDGGTENLTDLSVGSAAVHLLAVGRDRFNLGLTSARLKRAPRSPRDFQLFAGVRNFDAKAHRVPLSVRHGGQLVRQQEVEVPAEGEAVVLFDDLADISGPVEVRIEASDLLPDDDVTLCLPPASNQRTVALVGAANPFIRLPFALQPNVRLLEFAKAPATLTPLLEAHWVVYHQERPDPRVLAPGRRILALAPPSLDGWWERAESTGGGAFQRLETGHPFFLHLRLNAINTYENHRYQLLRAGQVLTEGSNGPWLVWLPAGPDSGIALLTFPPLKSNLPLAPAWPILLANLLHDQSEALERSGYLCGQVLEFPARGGETADLLRPDGSVTRLTAENDRFRLHDAWQAGLYRLREPGRPDVFVVFSALLPGESDLTPRRTLATAGGAEIGERETITTNRDLRVPLVLLALAIVCVEGWLFHQRRVEFA